MIVVESANKQFQETLAIFAKARKDAPFILAAPLVTTNGGTNYRQADTYHYSEATWSEIEKDRCKFDMDGIAAVAADVQKHFSGEERYFLTGWEAGGHTVWAMILQHPERMAAAAPAVSNYAGRCLDAGFSSAPARVDGGRKAAASSSSASCSKQWQSSPFPWTGFFTLAPRPKQNHIL